jgi:hypothetical protein
MRHLPLALFALLVVACAPALAPTHQRVNGDVLITLTANVAIYQATLTILDAVTGDERCASIGAHAWCLLGDLQRGETLTILATGDDGLVACTAAGFLEPDLALASYRPFACRALPRAAN